VDDASQFNGIVKDTRKFRSHFAEQPILHGRISDLTVIVSATATEAQPCLAGHLVESLVPHTKTTFAISFASIPNKMLMKFLRHLGLDHCAFASNNNALSLSRADDDGLPAMSKAWCRTCFHGRVLMSKIRAQI